MLALAPSELIGSPSPRIGPPEPLRHDLAGYRQTAASIDIVPMPWQDTSAKYLTARTDDHWTYREVAIVVGRQNGKTTVVKPLAIGRMLTGRRVLLIAQVRELPRVMFEAIADIIEESNPELLPRRRGKIIWPRRGAGSESIVLTNGGTLRIAAATTGAARGLDRIDDLIIDELREAESFDVINAAKPAQRFSTDPQTIYLSNAGTDASVVLNALRKRAGADASLAYLEWSADPDYEADDRRGWVQADPAIGHYPQVLRDLEQDHTAALLSGNMAGFETEALCRWVPTMMPRLVDDVTWQRARALRIGTPHRTSLGIGYDPSAGRASIVAAWRASEGHIELKELFDVLVDETGMTALGADVLKMARSLGTQVVGYDDATDRDLARQFTGSFFAKRLKKVIGKDFANATDAFVRGIETGQVRWSDCSHVTEDLQSTARKDNDETGAYHAVKAKDERAITAALAAVRAVWLASDPKPSGSLRVR